MAEDAIRDAPQVHIRIDQRLGVLVIQHHVADHAHLGLAPRVSTPGTSNPLPVLVDHLWCYGESRELDMVQITKMIPDNFWLPGFVRHEPLRQPLPVRGAEARQVDPRGIRFAAGQTASHLWIESVLKYLILNDQKSLVVRCALQRERWITNVEASPFTVNEDISPARMEPRKIPNTPRFQHGRP